MSTDNCNVVETAIEIGWEGLYFDISNELYEWKTWQMNKFSMNLISVLINWM